MENNYKEYEFPMGGFRFVLRDHGFMPQKMSKFPAYDIEMFDLEDIGLERPLNYIKFHLPKHIIKDFLTHHDELIQLIGSDLYNMIESEKTKRGLTVDILKDQLKQAVEELTINSKVKKYEQGRIDAFKSVIARIEQNIW